MEGKEKGLELNAERYLVPSLVGLSLQGQLSNQLQLSSGPSASLPARDASWTDLAGVGNDDRLRRLVAATSLDILNLVHQVKALEDVAKDNL